LYYILKNVQKWKKMTNSYGMRSKKKDRKKNNNKKIFNIKIINNNNNNNKTIIINNNIYTFIKLQLEKQKSKKKIITYIFRAVFLLFRNFYYMGQI
jgi:hypothetical protein